MHDVVPEVPAPSADEDARLQSLGYKPQLSRVLGLFGNFAVAFTYLSPMVGIYSLFVLGVGTGGPAYVWLTWLPVIGMFFVASSSVSWPAITRLPARCTSTASSPSGRHTDGSSAGSTGWP